MAERALHPPIHLVIHPDEPVRSLEAAAKVVRRHAASHPDRKAEDLLKRIETASTAAQAEAAGKAFRVGPRPRACCSSHRKTIKAWPEAIPQRVSLALEEGGNRLHLTTSIDR